MKINYKNWLEMIDLTIYYNIGQAYPNTDIKSEIQITVSFSVHENEKASFISYVQNNLMSRLSILNLVIEDLFVFEVLKIQSCEHYIFRRSVLHLPSSISN